MACQYGVMIEGVSCDIEYAADRDIETGAPFVEIGSILIGGVSAGPLLYAIHHKEADRVIYAALEASLAAEKRAAALARSEAALEALEAAK